MRALVLVLVALFLIAVLWIALANAAVVVVLSMGLGEPRSTSLAMVIVCSVIAGVVFTGLLAVLEGLALRVENMRLRRRLKRLTEEAHDLRNLSLGGPGTAESGASRTDAARGPRAIVDET